MKLNASNDEVFKYMDDKEHKHEKFHQRKILDVYELRFNLVIWFIILIWMGNQTNGGVSEQ